jgi:hypothetical protein
MRAPIRCAGRSQSPRSSSRRSSRDVAANWAEAEELPGAVETSALAVRPFAQRAGPVKRRPVRRASHRRADFQQGRLSRLLEDTAEASRRPPRAVPRRLREGSSPPTRPRHFWSSSKARARPPRGRSLSGFGCLLTVHRVGLSTRMRLSPSAQKARPRALVCEAIKLVLWLS